MILGCKDRFVQPILNGSKIHSIRKGRRWRAGLTIHFATGVRTKNYDCFKEKNCFSTQRVELRYSMKYDRITVRVDGRLLYGKQIDQLAYHDGFGSWRELRDFFFPGHRTGIFRGQIIHWTGFKY